MRDVSNEPKGYGATTCDVCGHDMANGRRYVVCEMRDGDFSAGTSDWAACSTTCLRKTPALIRKQGNEYWDEVAPMLTSPELAGLSTAAKIEAIEIARLSKTMGFDDFGRLRH